MFMILILAIGISSFLLRRTQTIWMARGKPLGPQVPKTPLDARIP